MDTEKKDVKIGTNEPSLVGRINNDYIDKKVKAFEKVITSDLFDEIIEDT